MNSTFTASKTVRNSTFLDAQLKAEKQEKTAELLQNERQKHIEQIEQKANKIQSAFDSAKLKVVPNAFLTSPNSPNESIDLAVPEGD